MKWVSTDLSRVGVLEMKLLGIADPIVPEMVAGDGYVPVSVRWSHGAFYAFIRQSEPTRDVGCEIVLEPATGRLARFVVVQQPPISRGEPLRESPRVGTAVGLPIFDTTGFALAAGRNVRDFHGERRTLLYQDRVFFEFSRDTVAEWVVSTPARFGFDSARNLVGVEINRRALPGGIFALGLTRSAS